MRIPSGKTDQNIYFVAVDSTDLKTRETGLSSFTVYRSRNGGAATAYTTPTVAELSAANMPGVYALLIDEDTTIGASSDSEEYVVHITQASMAPVTRSIELYRRDTTSGQTITVANGAADADIERLQGSLIATPSVAGVIEVDVTHWLGTAPATPTVAGVPEVDVTHINGGATNGNNATLSLAAISVVNSGGSALTVSSTGANGHGINASGNGTGHGINTTGGATGRGITATGGATSGAGASFLADGSGSGFSIVGAGANHGVSILSGSGATGNGINCAAASTNGHGINCVATGVGVDLNADNIADIQADTDNIQTRLPAALVGGRMDSSIGAMAANTLTAAATAADFGTEVADAIWDEVIEGSTTARQSVRLNNSALGSKLSGAATATNTFRDIEDTKNRIVATVDSDGNRTAITLDLT